MHGKLSRRKIAAYAADHVKDGSIPERVLQEVAAYLYEERRTRELMLVVRAIEDALLDRGITVATVTSARPLSDVVRQSVIDLIGSPATYLRETVDPAVLGGVKLQTPEAALDATVSHTLARLREAKI